MNMKVQEIPLIFSYLAFVFCLINILLKTDWLVKVYTSLIFLSLVTWLWLIFSGRGTLV